MIGQGAHDDLRRPQELLGHQMPSGDVGVVLERALRSLVLDLERRKFAATERPQHKPRPTTSPRHVPAHVKRAVWERDQGQCTFISDAGQRCPSRTLLEFDHMDEVARGGQATVDRMRLRCRAHNQYAAECPFGAGFMDGKREEARQAAAARKARQEQAARAAAEHQDRDVIKCLRQLGFRAEEVRGAAALCENMPDASLEQRVRMALSYFRKRPGGSHPGPTSAAATAAARLQYDAPLNGLSAATSRIRPGSSGILRHMEMPRTSHVVTIPAGAPFASAPRIVCSTRPGVDWNTCGQAAIATLLAHARRGPFAADANVSDAEAIDWVRRDFPADMPFGMGTSGMRIAHALRACGLGVERVHSGWFGRGSGAALERVAEHVREGHPVPVCIDIGLLGGTPGAAHWAVAMGFEGGGVRLGNTRLAERLPLERFLQLWRCRLLPYGHNHAAILAGG